MAQYAAKRRRAQTERQGRVERARELDPAIALLQEGMARRFSQATRQMLGNRERSAQIAARLRAQTLADQEAVRQRLKALGPVSYTHLDVYKRQGLDSRRLSIRPAAIPMRATMPPKPPSTLSSVIRLKPPPAPWRPARFEKPDRCWRPSPRSVPAWMAVSSSAPPVDCSAGRGPLSAAASPRSKALWTPSSSCV